MPYLSASLTERCLERIAGGWQGLGNTCQRWKDVNWDLRLEKELQNLITLPFFPLFFFFFKKEEPQTPEGQSGHPAEHTQHTPAALNKKD